jgi:hypothetical protein
MPRYKPNYKYKSVQHENVNTNNLATNGDREISNPRIRNRWLWSEFLADSRT